MERFSVGILVMGVMAVGLASSQTEAPSAAQNSASSQVSDQKTDANLGHVVPYQPKFTGDPARSEAEALALGYMRTVLRAEHAYKKRHNAYAESLTALAGTGSFTKRMAQNTDRGDYTASFRPHRDGQNHDGFVLTLTPKHMDGEHRSFYAEEDGVIHADDQKAADLSSPKVQ
jgi:hypothetical protein